MKAPTDLKSEQCQELKLNEAVRVKSAELWLKLGQHGAALLELQKLPVNSQGHPWAAKVFQKARKMARAQLQAVI